MKAKLKMIERRHSEIGGQRKGKIGKQKTKIKSHERSEFKTETYISGYAFFVHRIKGQECSLDVTNWPFETHIFTQIFVGYMFGGEIHYL